jgi:hypothetical protein
MFGHRSGNSSLRARVRSDLATRAAATLGLTACAAATLGCAACAAATLGRATCATTAGHAADIDYECSAAACGAAGRANRATGSARCAHGTRRANRSTGSCRTNGARCTDGAASGWRGHHVGIAGVSGTTRSDGDQETRNDE